MQLKQALEVAQGTMAEGPGIGFLQRVWIFIHGGNLTAAASCLCAVLCVLTGVPLATMNGTVLVCGASYQRFWARDRHRFKLLVKSLIDETTYLESSARGEALEYATRTAKLLQISRWILFLDVPVSMMFMVVLPLITGNLTFDIWPPLPWVLTWALESVSVTCTFVGYAGLQLVHVSFVLVASALFRVLAGLFEELYKHKDVALDADAPDSPPAGAWTARELVLTHQRLLNLVSDISDLFQHPLFHIYIASLAFTLVATLSMLSGERDPYILGLFPLAFFYMVLISVEGDKVQESSELVMYAACQYQNLQDKDLITVMLRARRPATVRAYFIGTLSLSRLDGLLRSWYSFTQMAAQMK